MKKFLFLLLAFLLYQTTILAQSGWQLKTSGTFKSLRSVHFTLALTGWVAGDGGTILKTTNGGENWFFQSSGTTLNLNSIYFISSSTGWISGQNGIILKTTSGGDKWDAQTSGTTEFLYSVHFSTPMTGWAVGSKGIILSSTNGGINWFSQFSGTTETLYSLYFRSLSAGWVVGGSIKSGIILKSTDQGSKWLLQNSSNIGFYAVHFFTPAIGCSVGLEGSIFFTTNGGTNWKACSQVITGHLNSVNLVTSLTGWTVGDSGKKYKTSNGGLHWSKQETNTSILLSDVQFPTTMTGLAVGENGTILKTTNGGTSSFNLTLLARLEGFYNQNSQVMKGDTINVTLVYQSDPDQHAKGYLDSNGYCTLTFNDADHSTPFYLLARHRNSIETWSDTTMLFSSYSLTYDFTSAASQAYGNNMVLRGTEYCIYGGDVNQDGIVDATDQKEIDSDTFNFVTGYVNTDVTGDNLVDASDALIAENNALNFVTVITP